MHDQSVTGAVLQATPGTARKHRVVYLRGVCLDEAAEKPRELRLRC
jgi:hypothetical protein